MEDFVECMLANSYSPRIFAETFHRCQVVKVTRTCLHKEYSGFEVYDFMYAMKVCPGYTNLLNCLGENLRDYPKCFPKLEEKPAPEALPEN